MALWWEQAQREREREREREQAVQRGVQSARYGVGMIIGVVAVRWIKRRVKRIPVVGSILGPILGVLPAAVAGCALGAAAVYSVDQGDVMAVRDKLLPEARQQLEAAGQGARHELERWHTAARQRLEDAMYGVRRELDRGRAQLEDLGATHEEAARKWLPDLERQVDELGSRVMPTLEREYLRLEREAQLAARDYEARQAARPQRGDAYDTWGDRHGTNGGLAAMEAALQDAAALLPAMASMSERQRTPVDD